MAEEFYDDMDGDYLMDDYYDEEEYLSEMMNGQYSYHASDTYLAMTAWELLDNCVLPTVTQAIQSLGVLLVLCLVSRLTGMLRSDDETGVPSWLVHASSMVLGLAALHVFFQEMLLYLVGSAVLCYLLLFLLNIRYRHLSGLAVSILIIVILVVCELYLVDLTSWHKIRGAQMILSMKVISLAFDISSGAVEVLPSLLEVTGYLFHVGTVIFGPWVSFQEYKNILFQNQRPFNISWLLKLLTSGVSAVICLLVSTCILHWFIMDQTWKWAIAYRDAQSFRFSHYFVSFVSELTMTLSGLGATKSNGDIKWNSSVTKPLHVELPRSLVEVVTNWNLPMHYWLKTYVFKNARPVGTFTAILLTYAASSLLHGLNFQLAAVLLSLGFYSYIEFVFRNKLSTIFNACIQAKKCKPGCDHQHKSVEPCVVIANICFGLLSMMHLAYLGLMFDSSSEEDEGYTMDHTLSKWGWLDYTSHWIALATYIFHILI